MKSDKFRLTAGFISACLGVLALGGCPAVDQTPQDTDGGGDAVTDKNFVGQMQEMDALIGMVTDDDQVMAYICDAVEGGASRSGWYEGLLIDGEIQMTPVIGTTYEGTGFGSIITATLSDDIVDGALELEDGTRFPFIAELTDSDSTAGLYAEQDEDDDALISVVVSEDGEAKGLSRFRRTGWTSRVTLRRPPPSRGGRISVNLKRSNGSLLTRDLVRRRRLPILRPIIKPKPAPAPTGGLGTLMILTSVKTLGLNVKVDGYVRKEERPDPIGVPTIKLSAQFADPNAAKRIPMGLMRVRVIDATGKVLSTQIIDDPLHGFLEVPYGLKGEEAFWIRSEQRIESFLVAVPNIKGARRVLFTRYTAKGYARHSGLVDLDKDPVKKPFLREQESTMFNAADAAFETVAGNGESQNRFDLLILADGYQAFEQNTFNQDVINAIEGLWTIPIYAEFQAVINIHTAFLPSVESGASTRGGDQPDDIIDTVFESYFDCDAVDDCRLLRLTEAGRLRVGLVALESENGNFGAGSIDAKLVLVNDATWAGGGGAIVTMAAHPDAWQLAAHELGHTVVGLGDEYESEYNDAAIALALTRPNISGPLPEKDTPEETRNQLKWIDLVAGNTSIPTQTAGILCGRQSGCSPSLLPEGTVGMYEGAGYQACDSYRPTTTCSMRCSDTAEFCPVCVKEFRDTYAPFAGIQPDPNPDPDPDPDSDPTQPIHDIYMRDNSLDNGNVPSPHNVADLSSGSSAWVKIWHSVDIRVDAPPFDGNGAHENPIAGVENHVYVTVHNRGTLAESAPTTLLLYYTDTIGTGPAFPGGWSLIGSRSIQVDPGPNGESRQLFEWPAADLPPHVCLIATVSTPGDEAPPQTGGLGAFVRLSNNVTQKNVHAVNVPEIEGWITNLEREVVPIVLRIDAWDVPIDTDFELEYQQNITLVEFVDPDPNAPPDPSQMDTAGNVQPGVIRFRKSTDAQYSYAMRTTLPSGGPDPEERKISSFTLRVILPGGTPVGNVYTISIDQFEFDTATESQGLIIGGNTYQVSFD